MWELIRINKRNSVLLLMTMAACLITLGIIIGIAVAGPDGGTLGMIIAAAIWAILTIISFSAGDQILLGASNAREVSHNVHPQLFNIVEEMSIASGLPMPKVYIIDDPSPNAFATGAIRNRPAWRLRRGFWESSTATSFRGLSRMR